MAEKLLDNDATGFWKEVKALNRDNTSLPCTIEGVSGGDNKAELWRQHYSKLFDYVKSDPYIVGKISSSDNVQITAQEVLQAISLLADNKASGSDKISGEHLKYASPKAAILTICFTGFMSHGVLPD